LLCQWAAGDPAALARARTIADGLAAFSGEHLLDDAVSAIERANEAGRATLLEAHRVYCGARKASSQRDWTNAEAQFRRAAEIFARGGSPMADAASYDAAT